MTGLLKKYLLGLPLANIALALLYHFDFFLVRLLEDPSQQRGPVGYFFLLFMALMFGGYVLLGAVFGFKLGKRRRSTIRKIILYTCLTFVLTCFITYLQYPEARYGIERILFSGEQTVGFFIGGTCGHWWKNYKNARKSRLFGRLEDMTDLK